MKIPSLLFPNKEKPCWCHSRDIARPRGLKARVVTRILISTMRMVMMLMAFMGMMMIIAKMLILMTAPILAAAPRGLKAGWRVRE